MSDNNDSQLSDPGKDSLIYSPSKVSWAVNSFVLETAFTAERKFLYFTSFMILGFIAWGFLTSTSIIVNSSGHFFNQAPPLPVTSERTFYVRKVLVAEGQSVQKGTVLISAKDERLEQDLAQLNERLNKLELNLGLLRAGTCQKECVQELRMIADSALTFSQILLKDGQIKQELGVLESDLKNLNSSLTSLSGLETSTASLKMRIASNAKKIHEIERRNATSILAMEYEQLKSEMATSTDQLNEAEEIAKSNLTRASDSTMMGLNNFKVTLKVFLETADIVSPVSGKIAFEELKGPGQLISPGMILLKLLPDENQVAINLEVMNQDISKIQAGLPVKLDIEAYPSSEYGVQEAVIDFIPVVDASSKTNSNYKVIAKVKDKYIVRDGKKYELSAGMKTKAKILIRNEKTIIYFMKKVFKFKDDVFGS